MGLRELQAERAAAAREMARNRAEREEERFASAENQAAIRALREDPRYGRLVEHVTDRAIGTNAEHMRRAVDLAFEETESDPNLRERFERIIVGTDTGALRENGRVQLDRMRAFWDGNNSGPDAERRLRAMENFVAGWRPIRGDRPGLAYERFVSPRESGTVSSFGPQDVVVQADRFVYGSFDGAAHAMAGRPENAYVLDEGDIIDRAQIVMQDAANMVPRGERTFLKRYLDNTFDYQNGKEIIALYLASAFESPEEAGRFLAANNSPMAAQRWDAGALRPGPTPEISYEEGDTGDRVRERYAEAQRVAEKRAEEIGATMRAILDATGIEPPLSLEVRVPDRARIIPRR